MSVIVHYSSLAEVHMCLSHAAPFLHLAFHIGRSGATARFPFFYAMKPYGKARDLTPFSADGSATCDKQMTSRLQNL